jgi:ubiquinone/menaquinone biosynthesis C-methylase UbiE
LRRQVLQWNIGVFPHRRPAIGDYLPFVTTELDMSTVEDFAGRLFGFYIGAGLASMVDIGHRSGLFDAMARAPGTSEEIAARAGLSERHVREWLGAITTAGIVLYDAATKTYALPPEHAICLTGETSANLAQMSPAMTFFAGFVPDVVRTFREGGGIPYERYRPEFTELMDKMNRYTYDEFLVEAYLPAADGLVERLGEGIRVADLGCGTGHCINLMAKAFPASTFVGFDLADDAIDAARKEAETMGLSNASFEVRDVRQLPTNAFDLVTAFDAIHDQADPAAVLRGAYEALRPNGVFLMVDINASSNLEDNIDNPMVTFAYVASTMHCMQVSLAMDGVGLGTAWGHQLATQMLEVAGFTKVEKHDAPPADPFNLIYVSRK